MKKGDNHGALSVEEAAIGLMILGISSTEKDARGPLKGSIEDCEAIELWR